VTGPRPLARQPREGTTAAPVAATLELFDPARLVPTECSVCGAIRAPLTSHPESCAWQADRAGVERVPWPTGCLARPDPATNPIPY
jgi:hypothetical protein